MIEVRPSTSSRTTADVDRDEAMHAGLVAGVRELADLATALLDAPIPDDLGAEADAVAQVVARLSRRAAPGPVGVQHNAQGRSWAWGNAALGFRNAVAPPLEVLDDPARADVPDPGIRGLAVLDRRHAYPDGQPADVADRGLVAMLIDQLMGMAASRMRRPTFTATLTCDYHRDPRLGPLHLFAVIEREGPVKVVVRAHADDADGRVLEAEGLFVVPAWAR